MSKIAFLLDQMFEDSEFRVPYDRLRAAGHDVEIVGVKAGTEVEGYRNKEHVKIEKSATEVDEAEYDAVVIPGGYSPDHLRTSSDVVRFTRAIANTNRPVAAVCHAPSLLIEADLVEGRQVTSWPSIRTDLLNAGARWVDRQVVVDGNVITSRNPGDLEAFCDAILRALEQGVPGRTEPSAVRGEDAPPLH